MLKGVTTCSKTWWITKLRDLIKNGTQWPIIWDSIITCTTDSGTVLEIHLQTIRMEKAVAKTQEHHMVVASKTSLGEAIFFLQIHGHRMLQSGLEAHQPFKNVADVTLHQLCLEQLSLSMEMQVTTIKGSKHFQLPMISDQREQLPDNNQHPSSRLGFTDNLLQQKPNQLEPVDFDIRFCRRYLGVTLIYSYFNEFY